MDLNITKKSIKTNGSALNEQVEAAIDIEFTLPDYCPKIDKIIKCTLKPVISNVSYTSNSVTADGEGCISLLYSSADDGGLFGYETAVQFSKSIDTALDCDKMMITARAQTDYINCRAVNENKLDVHGAVTIFFSGVCTDEVDILVESDDNDIQLKTVIVQSVEMCGYVSKQFMIDEELSLPQMSSSIENIIRTGADVELSDVRFVADKAIVKGNLFVNVLYRSSSGGCESYAQSIPFEQMMDISGADDSCIRQAEAMICSLKIKPYTNADGECRSMMVSAKINVDLTASRQTEQAVVSDCYSVSRVLDVSRNEIMLTSQCESVSANHGIRETLEFLDNSLSRVIDVSCEAIEPHYTVEGDTLKVRGVLNVSVIAEGEDSKCCCFEKYIEYSHDFNISCSGNVTADIRAFASSCSYSIKSADTMELRAQIDISGTVYSNILMSVVTDISADEDSVKPQGDMPSIVLYFAKKGESIWQIAMRYNTASDLIMQANGLDSDILTADTVLMIPGM